MDANSFYVVLPEVGLLLASCLIMLVDAFVKDSRRGVTYALSLLTVLGFACMFALRAGVEGVRYGFGSMVLMDPLSNLLKCFAALALGVTLVYARPYVRERGMLSGGGDFYLLSLFSLLGMCVMISANHLLLVYLGIELLTLCAYAQVALRRDHSLSIEAAMKYFVLGAMASGFLLFGMSLLYGATGHLGLSDIQKNLGGVESSKMLVLALVFLVAGLAFKLGAVPFHMWVPDVYHGAPTAVTLLIGGASKFAAFAIVLRLLAGSLQPLAASWQPMLMVLAVASLALGNLAAIAQSNVKRMLAYSAIAQMGFMLLGLLAGSASGKVNIAAYSASLVYVVAYVLTTLACFGIILLLAREGFESEELADFAGLSQRSPLYAAIMSMGLLSLAGIPPFIGFYAKFTVLQALVAQGSSLHLGLAVFAVVMSLIAAFYYLRLIKLMWFDEPITATEIAGRWDVRVVLAINGALVLLLGLMPAGLLSWCANAIRVSFPTL